MRSPRSARRLVPRGAVAAAIALAALVGPMRPASAAANPACRLLTPKVIKATLGLTLPKGKPTTVIDEEEETSACIWASGTPSPQQISTGTPGIYLGLVKSGAARSSDESSDDSDDDDTTQSLLEIDLKVAGGQSGFAAAIPGGGGTTAGIVFNDSSGAAILIGSTAPTAIQLDAFASAIAKKHG